MAQSFNRLWLDMASYEYFVYSIRYFTSHCHFIHYSSYGILYRVLSSHLHDPEKRRLCPKKCGGWKSVKVFDWRKWWICENKGLAKLNNISLRHRHRNRKDWGDFSVKEDTLWSPNSLRCCAICNIANLILYLIIVNHHVINYHSLFKSKAEERIVFIFTFFLKYLL